MLPASEVGGDYFDIVPFEGNCWIGIGDVAGHGLRTGLVMMMIQSVIAALVTKDSWGSPREVLRVLNSVIYENVRQRLGQDEHATLSLLRVSREGHVVFAGAHEDMILFRARTRKLEVVATPGTWIGAVKNTDSGMVDNEVRLDPGDLLVLYTDGVTEAMNAQQSPLGFESICREVESVSGGTVDEIKEHLVSVVRRHMNRQLDDVTIVVLRYRG
jgi:serine phosphatase RsbU (regulator of sigma subunit)